MAVQFKGGLGYYLHDAPWRPDDGYGYGTNVHHVDPDGQAREGSHGCVNLPLWAMKRLYAWIRLGDRARVVGW
jgi:lipoprotein-anchoring transpeptidase ErfK/SrfK